MPEWYNEAIVKTLSDTDVKEIVKLISKDPVSTDVVKDFCNDPDKGLVARAREVPSQCFAAHSLDRTDRTQNNPPKLDMKPGYAILNVPCTRILNLPTTSPGTK